MTPIFQQVPQTLQVVLVLVTPGPGEALTTLLSIMVTVTPLTPGGTPTLSPQAPTLPLTTSLLTLTVSMPLVQPTILLFVPIHQQFHYMDLSPGLLLLVFGVELPMGYSLQPLILTPLILYPQMKLVQEK